MLSVPILGSLVEIAQNRIIEGEILPPYGNPREFCEIRHTARAAQIHDAQANLPGPV
ncbi:MAG: hypothetical protein OJF52_000469 [Nitrospira sp.]|nr:MAG: hypothetical protein OJF52_000469 [Nitrospira sp.]